MGVEVVTSGECHKGQRCRSLDLMLSFFLPHAKCKPRQLGEVQVRRHASELEKNTPLCKPAEQHDSNTAHALHAVTCMDYVIFRCVGAEGGEPLLRSGEPGETQYAWAVSMQTRIQRSLMLYRGDWLAIVVCRSSHPCLRLNYPPGLLSLPTALLSQTTKRLSLVWGHD